MGGRILISGYVSMDRMIKIDGAARVGHTSMVTNKTNARLYPGGCPMNIGAALNRLGIQAVPIIRVGSDYRELQIPELDVYKRQGQGSCYSADLCRFR